MLKKLFLFLLVAAPVSIFAQEKIAYINANELFAKMPEAKTAQTTLETKGQALEKRRAAIETEFNALIESFQKTPTEEITPSIAADRQKQVEQMRERYDQFLQTSQQELEAEKGKLFAPIQEKMRKAIKEVGDENNYSYIFDAGVLLHIGTNAVDAGKQVKVKLGIKD